MPEDSWLSQRIVYFCYFLAESAAYKKSKTFFYDLLENPHSRMRPYFDCGMIALVLTSVYLLILEAKQPLSAGILSFEQIAISVFILEYLLRLWIYNDNHRLVIEAYEKAKFLNIPFRLAPLLCSVLRKKWEYISTPLAIIDLLAILPAYRPIRVLRLFLLFRVFKLFRYTRSVTELAKVLSEKRFELYTLGILVGFIVFASATAIYLFEAANERSGINTFFDAIYWSLVTISTVGYGDITPQSTEGRFVTLVLIISGIGVIAFSTSIIVSAFSEKLQELREQRVFRRMEHVKDLIIVCGYGRVGEGVVEKLRRENRHLIVIDKDENRAERAEKRGYIAICDDAAQSELLEQIGIRDRCTCILCITGDDVINVYITLSARHMNPQINIISRANKGESEKKLRLAGADHVIKPYEAVGLVAAYFVHRPVASRALSEILDDERGITLSVVPVGRGSFIDGGSIGSTDFRRYHLLLFGVLAPKTDDEHLKRDRFDLHAWRFYFNPPADFVLHSSDILVVFGHSMSIAYFKDQVEKSVLKRARR